MGWIKLVIGVELDGSETIVWDEGTGELSTTLAAGTYYGHADAALDATYPSLFLAVAQAMSDESALSGLGCTYTFEAATPTASSSMTGFGLAIVSDTGDWEWDATGTINADGWLGFRPEDGVILSDLEVITAPRTYSTAWFAPRQATRWSSSPERLIEPSTRYVEREDAYWFDRGARRTREMVWQYVPGAHVYTARAERAEYAETGDIAQFDTFNAFERVWDWCCTGGHMLTVWYDQRADIDLELDGNGQWEAARFAEAKSYQELASMLTLRRAGGELYDVSLTTVRAGTYTWEQ